MKNKFKRVNDISILILLFLSFFVISPCKNAHALSVEDERKMGEEFLKQIRKNYEFIDDDFAKKYFEDLGQYLTGFLNTKPFPFNFYIIKSNTLNAFAAPGGHIFFFSGLIKSFDSADELSAVLCHEIGHVEARHLAERIEKNKKINIVSMAGIIAGILIGGDAAEALMIGSTAAGVQALLNYSREDERQADQMSFKYIMPTGFSPKGLIDALEKIQKESWIDTKKIPPYLLSHPTNTERMSNIESLSTNYKHPVQSEKAEWFKEYFPYFKAVIIAKTVDMEEAENIFQLGLKNNPDSASMHYGLGLIRQKNGDYAEAVKYFEKALKEKPNFIPLLANIGEAYQFTGQDKKAISVFNNALKDDPDDSNIIFLLGISNENLEEYDRSIKVFEKLSSLRPVKNEVYYHLGIAYGKENILDKAHYNFGIYYKKIREMKKAEFHFDKAMELSKGNSALKQKIQEEQKNLKKYFD